MGPAAVLSVLVTAKGIASTNAQLAGLDGNMRRASGRAGSMGAALKAGAKVGAGAVLALGAALIKLGSEFDDAYDTIRVGTGATGKALDGLKKDFKEVVKGVPTDFKSASTAIADLNTRLGLTGKPLQDRSRQFLELSRITGTDVGTNIKTVTRAFGDWEVATADQGATLDKFFRAAQSSGATVDELAQQVVQFGAPLRQVGFSLDEATAMFAAFEKAGVNTQTMMPGLKFALKTFMAEGRDPAKALKETFEGIQDGTIGSSEALKIFGQRAGADMVEAVKQGRFELGDMTKALRDGSDTIIKAGRDTMDFGEKWQMIKNRVFVALEPLAMRLFDAVGRGMDYLPVAAEYVRVGFEKVKAAFTSTGAQSSVLTGAVETVKGALVSMRDTTQAVVDVALALWARFGATIVSYLEGAAKAMLQIVGGILKMLGGLADFVAGVFTGDWGRAWDGIEKMFAGAWQAMMGIVAAAWNSISSSVKMATTALSALLSGVWSAIRSAASAGWDLIKGAITAPVQAAASLVRNTLGSGGLAGWLSSVWGNIREAASTGWSAVRSVISSAVSAAASAVRNTIGANGLAGWLSQAWGSIREAASQAWDGVRRRIITPVAEAVSSVKGAIGNAKDGLIGWMHDRVDDIKNAAEALAKPFVAAFEKMKNAVKDVLDFVGKVIDRLEDVAGLIGKIKIPKISIPIIGGGRGTGDGVVGPAPPASGVDSFTPIAQRFGLQMTSAYRPGDPGYHGMNRARDYSNGFGPTSQMMAFAKFMVGAYGSRLKELIYSPLGYGIKNGQKVPNSFWGATTVAGHYNHVHVAMADGGHVKRSGWAMVGELGPELVKLPTGSTVYPHGTGPAGGEMVLHADIYIGGEKIDERVDVRIERRDRQTAGAYRAGVLS